MLDNSPEGWSLQLLRNVVSNETDKWDGAGGDVPYIGLEHIGQDSGALEGVGSSGDVVSAKNTFQVGDVLFGKLRPNLKKYWRAEFDGICSTDILVLRPRSEIVSAYLSFLVQSYPFLSLAMADAVGTKMPRTSWKRLGHFEFALPPLSEQERIAEILTSVDDSIRATQEVNEQAERVKRGLMEDLLTGGLGSDAIARGELPDGWRRGPLIELVTLKRGYDLPVAQRIEGDFPVVASNGPVGTHNEPAVCGPVVVTGRSGTIGKVQLYEHDCHPLNTTLYSQKLHGNDARYVAEFLRFFRLERFATGTGVPTLNRNLVHAEEIAIPPLKEQQRIISILASIDGQILVNSATLEQLQRLKRGLMSDLLTGRVRTVS